MTKRKYSAVQEHPNQEAQAPHFQILHNNLQDCLQDKQHFQHCCHILYCLKHPGQVGNQPLQEGTNTWRKSLYYRKPKACSYPNNHPHQVIHLYYYCLQLSGQVNSMVWTVVASIMILIEFITPLPINQYIQMSLKQNT